MCQVCYEATAAAVASGWLVRFWLRSWLRSALTFTVRRATIRSGSRG